MSLFSTTCAIFIIFGLALTIQDVESVDAVNLNTAGNYVILTGAGITTTGTPASAITGNVGLSPGATAAITGFGLISFSFVPFSISSLVTGKVHAADNASPTPATLLKARSDSLAAYNDAAGRAATILELGTGNLDGVTLIPAVYSWSSAVNVVGDVTLSGTATDVWIFKIAQTFGIATGKQIILTGGAQAKNVFWQVAGAVTLNANSVLKGTVLGNTGIALGAGASLTGRFLANTAVTLISNNLVAA